MAADGYRPVSLRQKSRKKTRGNSTISRRRISVKELGQADHQGWLFRKRDDKGFLGIKWKKYWFVLKKSSLYWYANPTADKAEGYINLTDFMIDRAVECKKKYAIRACHPEVMTFYFAAESSEEMNRWLNKLGLAAILYDLNEDTSGCYSEESDHEEDASEPPPPPYSEQISTESGNEAQGNLPPPYSSAPPSEATDSTPSPVSTMTSLSSASSLTEPQLSSADMVSQSTAVGKMLVCTAQVHLQVSRPTEDERPGLEFPKPLEATVSQDKYTQQNAEQGGRALSGTEIGDAASDEMEQLYNGLRAASLSPIGQRKPSTKREFRKSFIKRCKNKSINEKLHHVRALSSTLKAKEADLLTIEQLLSDLNLTSQKYREWKEANVQLLQDIFQRHHLPVREEENKGQPYEVEKVGPFTETSV